MSKKLTICIDFDDTFTADPYMWEMFIKIAKSCGHKIICATMRYKHEGECVEESIGKLCDEVIFTDRNAKLIYLKDLGINPDIWIDDKPMWLFQNG